jgi:hypothetical protein
MSHPKGEKMANKRFYQFLYSKQPKLTLINGVINIGATGAVSSFTIPGAASVTRLGTGIYKVKLQDNYVASIGTEASMISGTTGSAVNAGSFVTGTLYQITTLGTTDFTAVGLDSDYVPAVGQPFVATGAGSGTGTATAIGASGIIAVEVAASAQAQLVNKFPNLNRGASLIIQTFGLPASGQTPELADPANGSAITLKIWFKDSTALAI